MLSIKDRLHLYRFKKKLRELRGLYEADIKKAEKGMTLRSSLPKCMLVAEMMNSKLKKFIQENLQAWLENFTSNCLTEKMKRFGKMNLFLHISGDWNSNRTSGNY